LDLPEEDDFFTGERSRCEWEWEEESPSLVDPDVFFDFLGDLEKSFCIEKATELASSKFPAGRSCVNSEDRFPLFSGGMCGCGWLLGQSMHRDLISQ
jgi:hypothetical protein